LTNHCVELLTGVRIQASRRLIEKHELRLMRQCGDETELHACAFRERFHAIVQWEVERGRQSPRPFRIPLRIEKRCEPQGSAHRELWIEPRILSNVCKAAF